MIQIIAIGIIGAILSLIVRQQKPELAMVISLGTGIILILLVLNDASTLVQFLGEIAQKYSIDAALFKTVLKITGIAYLAEFGIQACKDAGESAIAGKVELGAKVLILGLCAPIVLEVLELLARMLP